MAVEKRNKKWYIHGKILKDDGTYYNYHRLVKGAKRSRDAVDFETDFLREYQDIKQSHKHLTFKELGVECMSNSKEIKQSTLITYSEILKKVSQVIGDKKINLITKKTLQDYINVLDNNYSKAYVGRIHFTISKVFNYAVDHDYIKTNPMKKVKVALRRDVIKKEMEYWEPADFKRFISVVDEPVYYNLYSFLYYMGCRKGEALALQWKDIDLIKSTVSIYKSVTNKIKGESWTITSPKTQNSIRTISMPKNLREILIQWKEVQNKFFGYNDECFIFGFDRPMPQENIRRKFDKYILLTEDKEEKTPPVKRIRIHDLRHSHASYLINNKSDKFTDFDIAKRLGDTVETLHDTYAHWFKSADKGIIDFMDNDY